MLQLGHTGTRPHGTHAYESAAPIAALKTEGGAVVSLLEKGGTRYLAIVNRDFHKAMPVELRFDGSAPIAVVGKDRSSRAIAGTDFRETIAPGDILVLSWRAAGAGL